MIQETIEQFFDSTCSANTFSFMMEAQCSIFVAGAVDERNHQLEFAFEVDFSQASKFYTVDPFGFSSGAVFVLVQGHPAPLCVVLESANWQYPDFGL